MTSCFPVAILDSATLGLPGQLALGCAPGRMEWGGHGDMESDLASLAMDHGLSHLVCLVQNHELESLGLHDLLERAPIHGLQAHHFPIPDGSVPKHGAAMDAIVETILGLLRTGQSVYVHCWAGLGRTGTVATCCLIALGWSRQDALATVRRTRPGAVETFEQEAFIKGYALHRQGMTGAGR